MEQLEAAIECYNIIVYVFYNKGSNSKIAV